VRDSTVYMKLDNQQPSGSFKSRGIGNRIYRAVQQQLLRTGSDAPRIHFYACSGGNAGLAAATAASQMGQSCVVVLPTTTNAAMRTKIEAVGAEVVVHGKDLVESDVLVRELVAKDPKGVYVSPFDHPDIWRGNSTIIDELYQELKGAAPDVIVCSVGGGGLLNGVLMGLERHGWRDTVVLAVETLGTASLFESLLAGEQVTLARIKGIAKSLGVNRVSDKTWELVHASGKVISVAMSDADAAMGCVRFEREEGIVVEPACGVSVSTAYKGLLATHVHGFNRASTAVIVVCGGELCRLVRFLADLVGSTVDSATLSEYEREYSPHTFS
jgi:L-serine/L-threonine ammonia-lyase